jgi:hypothetical protein
MKTVAKRVVISSAVVVTTLAGLALIGMTTDERSASPPAPPPTVSASPSDLQPDMRLDCQEDETQRPLHCFAVAQQKAAPPVVAGMYAMDPWDLISGERGCLYAIRDNVARRTNPQGPLPQCQGLTVPLSWGSAADEAECFATIRTWAVSSEFRPDDYAPIGTRCHFVPDLLQKEAVDLAVDAQCLYDLRQMYARPADQRFHEGDELPLPCRQIEAVRLSGLLRAAAEMEGAS